MMEMSRLSDHLRELVVGENQCDSIVEWASELPNQTNSTLVLVGMGERVSTLSETFVKNCSSQD